MIEMHPVLYVSSWPDALKSVMPRDHLNLGWVTDSYDHLLPQLIDTLARMSDAPLRFQLLCSEETLPDEIPAHVSCCDLRAADAGAVIAALDAIVLPEDGLSNWREVLEAWAIPPVIISSAQGGGSVALTVSPHDLEQLAESCLLLLTDPSTRRMSLDRIRGSLGKKSVAAHWRVEGVFDSSYSLALVNRRLAMALDADDLLNVSLLTYEQGQEPVLSLAGLRSDEQEAVRALWRKSSESYGAPDLALRNAWPPVVQGMRGHIRVLANYHWEETRFPLEFAKAFNRSLDLITVGSGQTAQFLEDAGVDVPIGVVGDGVDHLPQDVKAPPHPLPEGFRFLHVSSCFPRKALDVVLCAFGNAFSGADDVVLVIKTFPNPHNESSAQVSEFREAHPNGPVIAVFEDDWSEEEIAGLYEACDAYVAPSRGEGFGLPIAEAMRHQLPVITSDWGGHLDFCSEKNAWLIPTKLRPASTHLSQFGSLWAEPDSGALVAAMREVHDAALRGKKSRNAHALRLRDRVKNAADTANTLTWESVAEKTQRAVDLVVHQSAPTPVIRLGWMSSWGIRCGVGSYSEYMTTPIQPGGANSRHFALHVLAPTHDATEREDAEFVERCWQRAGIKPQRELIRRAMSFELDAVVIQYHWSFFSVEVLVDTIRALAGAGVAVFLDMHNTRGAPDHIADDYNLIHGLARASRILLHTTDDIQRAESWGLKSNLCLLPLAAYPITMPSEAVQQERRSDLGLEAKKVIASYGFLMPHKGIIELVESMPEILAGEPSAHLLLVNAYYSESVSKPLCEELQALIERLDLADHVTLITDFLSDEESVTLLKLADVVVFPYRESNESSSAAVRMAISSGCPIAITPVRLFADVASACVTLPGLTPSELAAGLLDFLDKQKSPEWRLERQKAVALLAQEMDARALSARMMGMIRGHLRRLDLD